MSSSLFRMPLKKQVTVLFCLFVLLPLVLVYTILAIQTRLYLREDYIRNMLQTLEQMALNIDYRLHSVMDSSSYLARSTELYKLLQSTHTDLEIQVSETNRLRNLLDSIRIQNDVCRVRLFVDNNHLYTRDQYSIFALSDAEGAPWYAQYTQNSHFMGWQETYSIRYPLSEVVEAVSFARALRDPSSYERTLGILVQDIPQSVLQMVLESVDIPELMSIHIVTREGYILSASDTTLLGTEHPYARRLEEFSASNVGAFSANGRSLLYHNLESTGWRIVAEFTPLAFRGFLGSTIGGWLLSMCVMLLVFSACMYAFMRTLVRTINQKSKDILHSVSALELDGVTNSMESDNHFNTLEESIHSLIMSVRSLMEEFYEERLRAKDIELRLLQAQINPHFLYNALDVLYWKALKHGAQDVAQQISTLAQYFRLTLHRGEDIVPIDDEIQLVNAYLSLQKGRFGSRFTASITVIPEALRTYKIPKLTLQPLAENALLHGILKKNGNGHLDITIKEERENIAFTIHDNGVGISREIWHLALMPPEEAESKAGYGLYSVNKRLMLFFGDACSLRLMPMEQEGTTIVFYTPKNSGSGANL